MRDEQTPKDVSSSFSVVKNLCDLPAITNPFSDFPKHALETRAKLNILDELVGFLFLERALKSRTLRLRSHGMGQIFDKLENLNGHSMFSQDRLIFSLCSHEILNC